jgi:hypothetical protein
MYEILRLDSPTELTTAATDVLLALVCIACARYVGSRGNGAPRLLPWKLAYWLFAAAALLGAIAHALHVPDAMYRVIWGPIYFCLGLAIACFLIGVIHDVAPARLRTLQPIVVGMGLLCFGVAWVFPTAFVIFLAWQGIGLLVAIVVYLTYWVSRTLPGAGWISVGLIISMAAAVIQGTAAVTFTLIWPFDHNGVFHLVQLPGLAAIAYGLVQVQEEPTARAPDSLHVPES